MSDIEYLQFNHVNSLQLIARAHQLVQEGFKYMFDEQLVTVWSAPNYCYRCGNMASILTIREDGGRNFTVYEAAEENERDKGMQKQRKMVSLIWIALRMQSLLICVLGKYVIFRVARFLLCRILCCVGFYRLV